MTDIEDVVRRSLTEQVRRQPPMTSAADRAVAGAAAVRRRHAAFTAGAVVVAVVAIVAGVAVLRGGGSAPHVPASSTPPSASPAPAPSATLSLPTVGVSALIGNNLLLPDGRLLSVAQVAETGGAHAAYQTRDGWLVEGYNYGSTDPDPASLWLFQASGASRRLVDHASGVVVAPDGRRLAWRTGNTLVVAHLDAADNVVHDATTQVDRGYPQMFAGSALIIGYTATGGGIDNWDVWVPQRGRYTPSWSQVAANGVLYVLGATADGRWAIGQVLAAPGNGSKDMCLARLDPLNALRVAARACGLPGAGEWASLSPDGHWLAYPSGTGDGRTQTVVVDAGTLFQQPRVAGTWPAPRQGIWTGPDTVVVQGDDNRFYRYRVGQPTGEQVTIDGMPPGDRIELVPKLS
jgi:hypothetical protein